MADLEFVRAYLDDCLIITKSDWNDHLHKLDIVLQRLSDAGLKVNATKSFFGQPELEYLGYWITRDGIQPLPKKVEAIQKLHHLSPRKKSDASLVSATSIATCGNVEPKRSLH